MAGSMAWLDFTDDEVYRAFRKAYRKAVKEQRDSFQFKGREVLVSYAKYVLEYVAEQREVRHSLPGY